MKTREQANIAFTAPHHAATQVGMDILSRGGSAIEATVAAAAMISVVYPHMSGIGGDSFWLIDRQNAPQPLAIDASGKAAANVDVDSFVSNQAVRGGSVALTQAATLRGWQLALANDPFRTLTLEELLLPAINQANEGFTVTPSLAAASQKLAAETPCNAAFRHTFEPYGQPLSAGDTFANPDFAGTLTLIANKGIDCFYTGELAERIITSLNASGSLLDRMDMASTSAQWVDPLHIDIEGARLFNLPAPTQGVSSLMILALVDRLKHQAIDHADWVHLIIEATKQSFHWRDRVLADPRYLPADYHHSLDTALLDRMAEQIRMDTAKPWQQPAEAGDTVWMGATDRHGQMVSFIQSLYWEFGSGVAIDDAGFVWNNRSLGFDKSAHTLNAIAAGKKPRQTLNPALAYMNDGRRMVYGSMGGDGQPQTQAALFTGYFWQELSLQEAITRGRWLLGKTWGDTVHDLKVEADLASTISHALNQRQHQWHKVTACNELMGHAGAIVTQDNQVLDAATDPRSDGQASKAIIPA